MDTNAGLKLNQCMSKIFLSKDCRNKDEICSLLQMSESNFPAKYLGLPLSSLYLKDRDCTTLLDKINLKIAGWEAKCLA